MRDEDKSKEQLIAELAELRRGKQEVAALESECMEAQKELSLLQAIIHAVNEAEDLNAAFFAVLEKICRATDWAYGEVWVPDCDGRFLEHSQVWYSSADGLDEFVELSKGFKFPAGKGLPGRVWSLKQPVWIKDVTQDEGFLRRQIAMEAGLKAGVAIPVLVGNEVIAVMVFFMFESREEDEKFVGLVSAVTAQLGTVIRRKRMEDALAQSEEHYRSIFESSQDCICIISLDGKFLSMNPAGCAINGLDSPQEVIGKSCTGSIMENREEIEDAVRRAARGETVAVQYKSVSKTGKNIWWDSKVTPVRGTDGNVTSILRISRDITEKKKAEAELLSLKKAVESMQIGVTLADIEGNILFANPAEARMHGYEVEELIGRNVRIYAPSERWNKIALKDMKEIKKTVKRESVNIRKDGSRFPVQLLSDAVIDSSGHIVGIVTNCEDITERKRLEEELLKVSKLESISTLSGGIAHDFNNILTIILGKISLAKMHLKPHEETFQILSDAEKGFKRAKDLTNQLLTFSKGGAPIKKAVHISELIKESADLVLTGSNVRCVYSPPAGLWPVEVDEGQMNQVINNLIINAVQAMPDGGMINIYAENVVVGPKDALPLKDGGYIKISVSDHGVGIQKEYLQRIFDPFFTTKQKGSGLGLATTYSIVRKHDGYITVESELGVGTTFHLYLPAAAKEIEAKIVSEERPVAGAGRVLIMDDEEILRESTGDLLKHLGYEVETAGDGMEAIQKYKKAKESGLPFDAVIMDLTIPGGMGGREAMKRLLKIDPEVKAIVSSGYSNDPIMADFRPYGFKGVVAKPYKIEELSDMVDRVMTGKD